MAILKSHFMKKKFAEFFKKRSPEDKTVFSNLIAARYTPIELSSVKLARRGKTLTLNFLHRSVLNH